MDNVVEVDFTKEESPFYNKLNISCNKSEYIKQVSENIFKVETKDIINFIKAQKYVVMFMNNDMSEIYLSFDVLGNVRLGNVWKFDMDPFSYNAFSLIYNSSIEYNDFLILSKNLKVQYPRIKYQKNYKLKQDIINALCCFSTNRKHFENVFLVPPSYINSIFKDYKQKCINVLSNLIMDFNYTNPTINYLYNYYNTWINLNRIILYYFGIYNRYDKILKFCIKNNIKDWKVLYKYDKIPGINNYEWNNFKYFIDNFDEFIESVTTSLLYDCDTNL